MELISTKLEGDSIHMRFEEPMEGQMLPGTSDFWFEFEVALDRLKAADGQTSIGNPSAKRLATLQLAALHQLQDAVRVETQRLLEVLNATR